MFPILVFFYRSEHERRWFQVTVSWCYGHNADAAVVFPHTVGTDDMTVCITLVPSQRIYNHKDKSLNNRHYLPNRRYLWTH